MVTFKRRLPLIACSIGTFLLVHTTAATVSVTAIERDLGAGPAEGLWIINGYSLAVAALLLAAGVAGDVLAHRRVFLGGMAVFLLGTAACAIAPTAAVLIAARIVQGAGGAGLLASMIPLLVHEYTGRRRAAALAIWSVCSALGGTVGTLGSGVFAHPGTWRWPFIASLPLAATAAALALAMPAQRPGDGAPRRSLDWAGAVWTIALMGSATFALAAAGGFGIGSAWTLGAIALAAASVAGVVVTERRVARPALPPSLFQSGPFTASITTAFAYYFAAFGPLPAMAAWLSRTGALDPSTAAALLAVQQIGFILVASLARVPERLHAAALVLSMAAIALGVLCGTAVVLMSLPAPLMLVSLTLSGAGAGLATPILPHRVTEATTPSLAGAAAGTMNAARQFGLAAGVAACGAVAASSGGTGAGCALLVAAGVAVAGLGVQWFSAARASTVPGAPTQAGIEPATKR